MRKIAFGFCFMVAIAPALAGEHVVLPGELVMGEFKPWTLISINDQGADTADLAQALKAGEGRRTIGAHYFPEKIQFNVTENGRQTAKQADFVLSINDFDCRRTSTYRLRNEEYYVLGDMNRTYYRNYIAEGTAKWSVANRDEPQHVIWQVLCKDATPNGMIDLGKFVGKSRDIHHSEVLRLIRNQIHQQKK